MSESTVDGVAEPVRSNSILNDDAADFWGLQGKLVDSLLVS
jgi:hypothetical protein